MALPGFQLQQRESLGADVYVLKLGCNADGTAVAAASSERQIQVFDEGLRPLQTLQGHADAVMDLSFFQADPRCLASCSSDGTAKLWDLRAPEAAISLAVPSQEAYSCAVGRADTAVAVGASEKIHLFDIRAGKTLRVYRDCHTDTVNHVRFHPVDSTKLLSGAEDNLVVLLDTDQPRAEEAMLAVIPNEESVRSFSLVGPGRQTLCCASTTEDVRIWGLGPEDVGERKAEFLGLRTQPLLQRDGVGGYVVETFYDQPSEQLFLLTGAGDAGELLLFRITLSEAWPVAGLTGVGHSAVVRSAVCLPSRALVTAGEDGFVCTWREEAAAEQFALEPSAYGTGRPSAAHRAAPY